MDGAKLEALLFFGGNEPAYALYEAFERAVRQMLPGVHVRVQKTQITFSGRRVFACASLLRVRRKSELPDPYLVITLGLPYPLDSGHTAVKVQPYPGRWTTHIVVGSAEEIDGELLDWVREAYDFAQSKRASRRT